MFLQDFVFNFQFVMNNSSRAEKSVAAKHISTPLITGELLSWTAIIHQNHCDYKKLFAAKKYQKKNILREYKKSFLN
jgi:hypothetical protein